MWIWRRVEKLGGWIKFQLNKVLAKIGGGWTDYENHPTELTSLDWTYFEASVVTAGSIIEG